MFEFCFNVVLMYFFTYIEATTAGLSLIHIQMCIRDRYVYSQKLGKNGYVNKDYLIGGTTTYATRTVSVATGYLALRSAKAYDSSNEIGQLYSGDTVQLVDTTDAQYWYIYSQKLCKYGYVNKDYLY